MSEPITLIVVDDDALVRDAIASIVQRAEGLTVLAVARSGEDAIREVRAHRPDVVLMDMRMPGMGGVAATATLRAGINPPHVIALTSFDEDRFMYGALEAGAAGFILKDRAHDELVPAIRTVAAGNAMISPEPTLRLIERSRTQSTSTAVSDAVASFGRLTDREQQIARLVATGASNQDIADELFVSHSTVKSAISDIMIKLDADNRVQVAIITDRAARAGSPIRP